MYLNIYLFYLQSGVLQLEDDDYIFEPVPHLLMSTSFMDQGASHIMYKASSSIKNKYLDINCKFTEKAENVFIPHCVALYYIVSTGFRLRETLDYNPLVMSLPIPHPLD